MSTPPIDPRSIPKQQPELHTAETVVHRDNVASEKTIERLRVPGGWLYISTVLVRGHGQIALDQTFIPDPEHG